MPVAVSYPGVYIEEIPSGVRTITGVSTAVTAFVGAAKRGPIDKAVRLLSYADYERRFGGLARDSVMSYAVRQFFLNGGSEAWVARLGKEASAASRPLLNSASSAIEVLTIKALDKGAAGNNIKVRVDYQTDNPASTFNLTFNHEDADNPSDNRAEKFTNLSMNSEDRRFVKDMVNGASELVEIEVILKTVSEPGTSVSGALQDEQGVLLDVAKLIDATHNQFQVVVNGLPPVPVSIAPSTDVTGKGAPERLASLCKAIERKVRAAASDRPALMNFTCSAPDGLSITMTSGEVGNASSVRVLPSLRNDAAGKLKLGILNGGIEADAVAVLRPAEMPDHAMLTSPTFALKDLDDIPSAERNSLQVSLDGYGPDTIQIESNSHFKGKDMAEKLNDAAKRLQEAVRRKRNNDAYQNFTCTVDSTKTKLVLASGSRGANSSVLVSSAASNDVAEALHLAGLPIAQGREVTLDGGRDGDYRQDDYDLFIGSRADREGIYALEAVDSFNLLCLPGVTDNGILMDAAAYCQERWAFLIADAPQNISKPKGMVSTMASLPKTEHGAVYYPWIKIADPLQGGKLNSFPPSGTIAGLYSRTDSARGVWKAPAGTEANLVGVQDLDYRLTDGENGTLNPLGVNCLRIFPGFGAVAWGARTLRGADQQTSEWKYIPIRRLALFIEESLYRGTQWVVFEPNDEPLWAQIRLNIGAFMQDLFRQGAFQGRTPREAYLVKCDKETTTQSDINRGIVNIIVGFAPLKPAEFVIIKIQQMAGQLQA